MNEKFLESNFKSIHITSDDAYGKCQKCGDHKEQWVKGRSFKHKTIGYYTFPDMRLRKRLECSKCVEKAKLESLSKRIRHTKIFPKNCELCNTPYIGKQKKGSFCSRKCNDMHFRSVRLTSYDLKCEQCSVEFTHNKVKKYCSGECEKASKRKPKNIKSCKTCANTFDGSSNQQYCKASCSPWSKEYINPNKDRKCMKCDNIVTIPKKVCEPCQKKKKPKKERKTYNKICPTCDVEFSTVYNYKQYCKPSHVPANIEARKLRKRTERTAKLSIETWKNIAEFKKSRPKGKHLDHIVPLNHPDVCGLHNTWNFQWLDPSDNSRKSNKFDGTNENNEW